MSTPTIIVSMAFGQSIFTDSPIWTLVTGELIELHSKRGRMHELNRVEAGTLTLKFKNISGNWWRYNVVSPFYPYVKPLTLIKVTATSGVNVGKIFYGVTESFTPGWEDERGGRVPTMTVQCVDLFKSFTRLFVFGILQSPAGTFPAQLSGARINAFLDEMGWPADLRDIDAGKVMVGALTPPTGGTNAMEHLFAVAESEGGIIFQRGDGYIVFQNRDARTNPPLSVSQATFTDSGDSLYILPEFSDDDTFIYNEARIKSSAIAEAVYADAAAQAAQGVRALINENSLIANYPDAYLQAYTIVNRYKDSYLRCMSLMVFPDANPSDLYPSVLMFELSTRITLKLQSVYNPALINTQYHIEAIEHHWRFDEPWQVKWQLWDASPLLTFNANHADYLEQNGANYTTVREAATGTTHNDEHDTYGVQVGQNIFIPTGYFVGRGYVSFDTTSLIGVNIISVDLLVKDNATPGPLTARVFSLDIVSPDVVAHPVVGADYANLKNSIVDFGHIDSTYWVVGGWNIIHLNSAGIAAINQGSITKFGLRSSNDINNLYPILYETEFLKICGVLDGSPPKLVVRFDNTMATLLVTKVIYPSPWGSGRSLNTVYSNLSSNTVIRVVISFNQVNASDQLIAYCDTSNPPTTVISTSKAGAVGGKPQLVFEVMSGEYYKVVDVNASTLNYWVEWTETLA